MRRLIAALLALVCLASAALADLSSPVHNLPPTPYNNLWNTIGDSTAVQETYGGTASAAGGSVLGMISYWTGGRIVQATTQNNAGIGGTTAKTAFTWPRPSTNAVSSASFSGTTMTVVTQAGGDSPLVGMLVTASGITGTVKINGTAAVNPTNCTPNCTGNGSNNQTYSLDTNVGTLSTRSTTISYLDTKTIAEQASGVAGTIGIAIGLNDQGATASYVITALNGLTVPGFPYPGYRPNGEGTDQPLPLYPCTAANTATCRGKPKVVVLLNSWPRGRDYTGTLQSPITDDSAMLNYSNIIKRLDYDSHAVEIPVAKVAGTDLTVLPGSNPQVIVIDSMHRAGMYDPTSGASNIPLGGWHPEQEHSSPVIAWFNAKELAERWMPAIASFPTKAILFDMNTPQASNFSKNAMMLNTTAGATSGTGATFVNTNNVPTGWTVQCSNCSGATVTTTVTAMPIASQGNKLCVNFSLPSPTTSGSLTLKQTYASTSGSVTGAQGTSSYTGFGTVTSGSYYWRQSWLESWRITSGIITSIQNLTAFGATVTYKSSPTGGAYSAGTTYMIWKGVGTTPAADTSHDDLMVHVQPTDFTGTTLSGTATSSHSISYQPVDHNGVTQDVNFTYCLARDSLYGSATPIVP